MNIQLELETVTPMFLRGADNETPELRPPAFKALFRYWWRTVQDRDLDSLREKEAKLFGSTDGKAPFSIRIGEKKDLGVPVEYSPLPHKNTFKMAAYDVGKQFNLCLIAKDASDTPTYRQIAKLGFLLGGVGNRSRRGFGSVRDTNWRFKHVCDLRTKILQTLHDVGSPRDFDINTCGNIKSRLIIPNYPVIREIFFGQSTQNFQSLLQTIGQATHDHHNPNDNALGHARGQQRMASPIYVSIQKVGQDYLPIVTQLHWNYSEYKLMDLKRQQKFIDEIIS